MAYDYAPITATALRLITKYGSELTFRAVGTVADPVTGLGAVAGTTRTMQGVQTTFDEKTFPDTRIVAGDMAFLIEGAAVDVSDKWVNGAAEWSVEAIANIRPNGSDIVAVKVLVRA